MARVNIRVWLRRTVPLSIAAIGGRPMMGAPSTSSSLSGNRRDRVYRVSVSVRVRLRVLGCSACLSCGVRCAPAAFEARFRD